MVATKADRIAALRAAYVGRFPVLGKLRQASFLDSLTDAERAFFRRPVSESGSTCQWNTYSDLTGAVTWPECDPILTCKGDAK